MDTPWRNRQDMQPHGNASRANLPPTTEGFQGILINPWCSLARCIQAIIKVKSAILLLMNMGVPHSDSQNHPNGNPPPAGLLPQHFSCLWLHDVPDV